MKFGDAQVIDRPSMLRDELGLTCVIYWMKLGRLADESVHASMRRFAEQVLAKFR